MEALSVMENFEMFRSELDEHQNMHEALVKASRDITVESKRLIFHLHRFFDVAGDEKAKLVAEADAKVAAIVKRFGQITTLTRGHQLVLFARAYSPGMQEFIEAITFKYLLEKLDSGAEADDSLLSHNKIKEILVFEGASFPVSMTDYLFGIADTTGEAMRACIKQMSKTTECGAVKGSVSYRLCAFVRLVHSLLSFAASKLRASKFHDKVMGQKVSVCMTSLVKCETACSQSSMALHEAIPFQQSSFTLDTSNF